jgi:hypothetical protein
MPGSARARGKVMLPPDRAMSWGILTPSSGLARSSARAHTQALVLGVAVGLAAPQDPVFRGEILLALAKVAKPAL